MRTIVVGAIASPFPGTQTISVWFRFPVPVARQSYYAKLQGSAAPSAPGDYANADAAEVTQLQSGAFIERYGFADVLDPASTLAQIQARLVNIYAGAAAAFKGADDVALADWGSSYNGTAWTMKSA